MTKPLSGPPVLRGLCSPIAHIRNAHLTAVGNELVSQESETRRPKSGHWSRKSLFGEQVTAFASELAGLSVIPPLRTESSLLYENGLYCC